MGDAAKRKRFDPKFGTPATYLFKIFLPDNEMFAELPFTVRRLGTIDATHERAGANGVVLFTLLQEPENQEARSYLERCMGEEAVEMLSEIAPELGSRFWAKLTDEQGVELEGFATHADLIDSQEIIFARDVIRKAV